MQERKKERERETSPIKETSRLHLKEEEHTVARAHHVLYSSKAKRTNYVRKGKENAVQSKTEESSIIIIIISIHPA